MATHKATLTREYTIQDARGPNINGHKLEVLDTDGDRIDYVDTLEKASESIETDMSEAYHYHVIVEAID